MSRILLKVFLIPLSLFLLLLGCAHSRGVLFTTEKNFTSIPWTNEELKQEIAVRRHRQTVEASYHFIRLKTAEKPHLHKHHDLVVSVLKGKAEVWINGRVVIMRQGDIIEIPRGFGHFAKNLSKTPSEVYAIFTPPLLEKDYEAIDL